MYAAKRKFHNLLESVTSPYTSVSSSTIEKEPITIREKLEARIKRQKLLSTATRAKAATTVAASNTNTFSKSTTTVEVKSAPNFAPWDRSQFLGRLKTFRHVDKWSAKPREVDEVQWAKRGWFCVGPERVKCLGGCGRELVIKLERKEPEETEVSGSTEDHEEEDLQTDLALVERYRKLIIDAHAEGCLWRRRGCDDSIYHLPLASQATCVSTLLERYTGLEKMADAVPSDISTPGFDNETIEKIYKQLLHPKAGSLSLHVPAMKLALFGWEVEPGHVQGLLSCQACFRRLGLWLFKVEVEDGESLMERLDVIQEHRDYCPWVNAASQNGASKIARAAASLPGWEVSKQTLVNAITSLEPESARPGTSSTEQKEIVEDFASVTSSPDAQAARAAKEEERWSRLKKMRRLFDTKTTKPKKDK